jgi:23S rRNA pseudouridine955/2504/2580 synthase
MRKLVIAKDDAGQRLDRFLRKILTSETLSRIFKLIRTGGVRVNGKKSKEGVRLAAGDEVEIRLPGAVLAERDRPTAASRARASRNSGVRLDVLHRDDHVLAIDKPPYLLVQQGESADEPTLDAIVAEQFGRGDSLTFVPSLAHRLDRGTSGIVLLGLSAEGLRGLTEAFRRRKVAKRYLALVAGRPEKDEFVVDLPLRRERLDKGRGAKVSVSHAPDALCAKTEFTVVARDARRGLALIEARPLTGRTHQIRVHLRAAQLPIVGDPTYGIPAMNREWRVNPGIARQFLHAWRVEIEHPVERGRTLVVESPLPDDLVRTLRWAGLPDPTAKGR